MSDPRYPDCEVKLIGTDGNAFSIIGRVCRALRQHGLDDAVVNDTFNVGAKEFTTMREDYQAVLDEAGFGKKIVPLPAAPVADDAMYQYPQLHLTQPE